MHIQEVAENGIDVAHFLPIHRSQRSRATIINAQGIPFRFELQTAYEGDGIGVPEEYVHVTTDWSYHGMGMFLGVSKADDFGTEVRHLFHFTPIPGERIHFRCAISVNLQTVEGPLVEMVQEKNAEITIRNLEEDGPIWEHKRYLSRPLLCDGDGPYAQLRVWTRQFFFPEADAAGTKAEEKTPHPPRADQDQPDAEERSSDIAAPISAYEGFGLTPAPVVRAADSVAADSAGKVARIFFEKMRAEFDPAAVNSDFVVQYDIGGEEGGHYIVEVRDKHYRVSRGSHLTPAVRVTIHASDWLRLHSGELGGARAYLTGKLKVAGDMKLARQLATIFPITTQ
jgi:putative sterol carrier protein